MPGFNLGLHKSSYKIPVAVMMDKIDESIWLNNLNLVHANENNC